MKHNSSELHSPVTTPTTISLSSLPHTGGGSKRSISILSLLRNPNFKTKSTSSSSSSSSPLMATPLQVYASSTIDAPNDAMDASSPGLVGANDLLIVGPGVLGRLVAQKWRERYSTYSCGQEHPGCQIFGQTVTTDHHDELIKIGINPSLKETKATHKFPYVVFCAPPSRTPDYPGDVREAVSSWSGEGSFLFTSSSAPYDCNDNGSCDEDSPVVPTGRSPRTDVLLKAEKAVLESGGSVVRLAGLYISFMKMQVMRFTYIKVHMFIGWRKVLLTLVQITSSILYTTRQQIMDLVNKSGKFSKKFESFTGTSDPLGKKLNNMKTREELRWEPKYPSFAQFLGVSL
ncbi:unnamed protein product [Camellia sinensis]